MINDLDTILDKMSKAQHPINHNEDHFSTTILQEKCSPLDRSSPIKDLEIYAYSKQGYGCNNIECQDTYSVIHELAPNTHFFAVYDGHGKTGKDVSLYVNRHIENYLKKNADRIKNIAEKGYIERYFKDLFKAVDSNLHKSEVDSKQGGSCCNAVFISNGQIYALNVGDSRSVMCRQGHDELYSVIELSKDQVPTRKDEKERVLKMGGIIERKDKNDCLRCWNREKTSGLAMTRTLGDIELKDAGVIPEPEIHKYSLKEGDKFIIVASDGIWDVMSSQDAMDFVLEQLKEGTKEKYMAMKLANRARKIWEEKGDTNDLHCDDITVIVAFPKLIKGRIEEEASTPSC